MAAITAMSAAAMGKAPIRNTRFTVTSLLLAFASPSAAIASSRKGLPFCPLGTKDLTAICGVPRFELESKHSRVSLAKN